MALALGRTVGELERSISGRELADWMEFARLEPFGPIRDNMHSAMLAALFYNAHRAEGTQPMTAEDFLIIDREAQEQRAAQRIADQLRALARPAQGNGKPQ